jgi:hypothetical protein
MSDPVWYQLQKQYADVQCAWCHKTGANHYAPGSRHYDGLFCGAVGLKQFEIPTPNRVQEDSELPTPLQARKLLWLNHGHSEPDLYGGPDEMFCRKCRLQDYVRAPFILLVRQYVWQTVPWGVLQDLVDSVPGETADADWWGDDLKRAVQKANQALDRCNIEGAEACEENPVSATQEGSSGPSAAGGV